MSMVVLPPMTPPEARECADRIKEHINGARALVLELHERRGWIALGYASWRECVVAEFDRSQAYLYRQLQAAQIEQEISPIGEIGTVPEGQLRALAAAPAEERTAIWQEATETAPEGKVTAKHVTATVERRAGKVTTTRPAQSSEPRDEDVPAGADPAEEAAYQRGWEGVGAATLPDSHFALKKWDEVKHALWERVLTNTPDKMAWAWSEQDRRDARSFARDLRTYADQLDASASGRTGLRVVGEEVHA